MSQSSLAIIPDRLLPASVRPPRVNLAGVCIYCGLRGCASARCIEIWSNSRWSICPDCDGTETTPDYQSCWCTSGVTEVRLLDHQLAA